MYILVLMKEGTSTDAQWDALAAAALRKEPIILVSEAGAPPEKVARALALLAPPPTPPPAPLLTPSKDTRIVFVSSSEGNDSNDGRSASQAKKTIAAGVALLRDGFPDWLLLKKGDTFEEPLGRWKKSGRSAQEPMVIWAHGEGDRPLLLTGPQTAFEISPGGGTPPIIHSLVVSGLKFYAHTRDPNNVHYQGSAGGLGVRIAHVCRDLLFDDLSINFYTLGMNLQAWQPTITGSTRLNRVTVSKCGIFDSYNESGHSQGIYADRCDGLIIEDCILDHNGWGEKPSAADDPTMFNHNLYIQHTCGLDTVIRRNILTRAASHALQLRSGGYIEDNFVQRCPIGLQMAYGDVLVPGAKFETRNNVVVEGTDIHWDPNNVAKAGGWGIVFANKCEAKVEGNVVAHCLSIKGNRRSIERVPYATYKDNIVYDWTSGPSYDVLPTSPAQLFKAPNRKVEDFMPLAKFYQDLRRVSRDRPSEILNAVALCRYIRDGFGLTS